MSETELYDLLASIKLSESPVVFINVSYDHFVDSQQPPFILYRNTDSTTLKADDKVFVKQNNYIVDLVTDVKDVVLEGKVETLFDNNFLPYEKQEDYIADERIYQIRYYI